MPLIFSHIITEGKSFKDYQYHLNNSKRTHTENWNEIGDKLFIKGHLELAVETAYHGGTKCKPFLPDLPL